MHSLQDLVSYRGVKVCRRFVQNEDRCPRRQCGCDGQFLTHARRHGRNATGKVEVESFGQLGAASCIFLATKAREEIEDFSTSHSPIKSRISREVGDFLVHTFAIPVAVQPID